MRIVIYNDSLGAGLGGPVTFVIDLANGLAAAGHEVRVLTASRGAAPESWSAANNPAIVLLPTEGEIDRAIGWADAVHLNGVWVPAAAAVARRCRARGKRYVLSLHGTLNDWPMARSGWKKRLYLMTAGRGLVRRAGALLCTSRRESEQAGRWAPREKMVVIPPLMDLGAMERSPGADAARVAFPALAGNGPLLLFLGRLHPVKGLEHLLRAVKLMGGTARLAIGGEGEAGYVASLRGMVEELGIGPRVSFLGGVASGLRGSLYRIADLFVLPSSQENFGLVLFESLAMGTPVLTTDRVDTRAELEAAGAIITEQEAGAIAAAIDAAIASGVALAGLGERGRAWVAKELDPGRVLEGYLSVYRGEGRIMGGGAGFPPG